MNEEAISYIMQKMSNWLDNSQMVRLEKTLEEALRGAAASGVESLQADRQRLLSAD